jgi:hypothetical protein
MSGLIKLWRGRICWGLLVAMLTIGLTVTTTPAEAAAGGAAAPVSRESAARATARTSGAPVEVLSARRETTEVFANPDGTFTLREYLRPIWARTTGGSWVRPDATLRRLPDGSIAPVASTFAMTFSGGGAAPFVTATRDGKELALGWPGRLPAPVLNGNVATYPEVLPGVDLEVRAEVDGFTHVLVVKNRTAAANPALRRLALTTRTKGLALAVDPATGAVSAKDDNGKVVLGGATPTMWDSATSLAGADGDPVGEPSRERVVRAAAHPGVLELIPDASLLTSPDAVYPLRIDPSFTGRTNHWTVLRKESGDSSYYDRLSIGTGDSTSGVLRVGHNDVGNTARTLLELDTSGVAGKHIFSATLRMWHAWSGKGCGNGNPYSPTNIRVHPANAFGSGTTWNNYGSGWGSALSGDGGYLRRYDGSLGCPGAGHQEFDVTGAVDNGGGPVTLALVAESESYAYSWKRYFMLGDRYDSRSPHLTINYNSYPDMPAALDTNGKGCVTGSGRPWLGTTTPVLKAGVSDSDPETDLAVWFDWARIRHDGTYGPMSDAVSQGSLASGATGEKMLPSGVLDKGDEFVGAGDWDRDGHPDVLARDPAGYLYLLPGQAAALTPRVHIGTGWGAADYTVAGVADWDRDGHQDIVARSNGTGELWLYPGQSRRGPSAAPRALIGSGFTGFTFAGLADWDRDGHQDLVARDSVGVLWLYPGESTRSPSSQARVQIGSGWSEYTFFGTIDWDRDGAPDVIAREESSGKMWLYPGSGARAPYGGSPGRFEIGIGWGGYAARTTPDFNADGKADIVAQQPGVSDWFAYPGSGARGYGGERWTIGNVGISSTGMYAWRARAHDGDDWSHNYSGWCEFGVDTVAPGTAPIVSSPLYKDDLISYYGSIGQTADFTFTASGVPDVAGYEYGWNDPPTTYVAAAALGGSLTRPLTPPPPDAGNPTRGGQLTLYARSVDRAGNKSPIKRYTFLIGSASSPVGEWKMGEASGTTLADSSGYDHAATLSGGAPGTPGQVVGQTAVSFDGTDDHAATASPVLNTGTSFSVAAWVKLTNSSGAFQTAVSQTGSRTSAFYLQKSDNTWALSVHASDVDTPTAIRARSSFAPAVGVWTHLAGVYDRDSGAVRLYVNGVLAGSATGAGTFSASGPLWIGRALYAGQPTDHFAGAVSGVRVWDRVLHPAEIAPMGATRVGWWKLDGNGYDDSGDGRDATPANVTWTADRTATPAKAAAFNGSARLATAGPALHTDQSFTVSAWVRITDLSQYERTAVAQEGNNVAAFYLGLRQDANTPQWSLQLRPSDQAVCCPSAAVAGPVRLGTWQHLVGVYDAAAAKVRLYVDNVKVREAATGPGWNAGGPLSIGFGKWESGGDFWAGDLDDVQVFQGVLPDSEITKLYTG